MKVFNIVQRTAYMEDTDFKDMNDRIQHYKKARPQSPNVVEGSILKSKNSKKPPIRNFKVQMN